MFVVPPESDSFDVNETFDDDLTTDGYILNDKQTSERSRLKHIGVHWRGVAYAAGFAFVCIILQCVFLLLSV